MRAFSLKMTHSRHADFWLAAAGGDGWQLVAAAVSPAAAREIDEATGLYSKVDLLRRREVYT